MTKSDFISHINEVCEMHIASGTPTIHCITASAICDDGTCVSLGCLPFDAGNPSFDDDLFTYLNPNEQYAAMRWICQHCKQIKTENKKHTSYGLKHMLESDIGVYMTNNQFKHAMLIAGFRPVNERMLNWTFRISETTLHKPLGEDEL